MTGPRRRAAALGLAQLLAEASGAAPSISAAIWHRGDPVVEFAPGTLFDLASLTKLFTTTAFLGLVSDGRVALDDPVGSVIGEIADGGARAVDGGQEPLTRRAIPTPAERVGMTVDPTRVTFRQLLTHTSGLAPWRALFRSTGPVPPPAGVDVAERARRQAAAVRTICASPFVAQPGTEIRYSDLGFIILGEAVARITGSPLEIALHERVTGPLGLDSATFLPLQAGVGAGAIAPTSIDDDWRGRRLHGEVEDENAAGMGGVAGHAGLFATASDVARFGEAWRRRDERLGIVEDTWQAALREGTPGMGEARGLGWMLRDDGIGMLAPLGPGSFGHTGFTGTSLAVDPGRQLVVALLTNRVHAGRMHEGIDDLRLRLHEAAVAIVDGGDVS